MGAGNPHYAAALANVGNLKAQNRSAGGASLDLINSSPFGAKNPYVPSYSAASQNGRRTDAPNSGYVNRVGAQAATAPSGLMNVSGGKTLLGS